MLKILISQVGGRLYLALPTLIGVIVIDFFLLQFVPGDSAEYLAAASGVATSESMDAIRARLGLDQGVLQQFGVYIWNILHLNFGVSTIFSVPALDLIAARLPNTLLLIVTTLLFSVTAGTLVGIVMAIYAGTLVGRALSAASIFIYSVPSFLKGLILIIMFSVVLGWLPSGGFSTIGADLTGGAYVWDRLYHLILPATTLSLFYITVYSRLVSATLLEVRKQDYIRTARAKGIPEVTIVFRHMLCNALIPVTTVMGMHIGMMLSGAVIVETVFGWPGVGSLAFESLFSRDYPVVLAILLLTSVMVIVANILVDIVHMIIDPRIRTN